MRRQLLGFIATVLLATFVVQASPSALRAQEADPLSSCVADTNSLSVLFLVDTSLSLQKTDSTNQRVAAIQSALSGLGALKSVSDVDIYAEFLEFGTNTRRAFPATDEWAELDADPAAQAALAQYFADRNDSEDTDYVSALEPRLDRDAGPVEDVGSLEMLERAPEGSCRLLVWFTDGEFDIDYISGPKTVYWTDPPTEVINDQVGNSLAAPALGALCAPGGLADQLRIGDGITTGSSAQVAVVALDQAAQPNFDLVRSIAEGQSAAGPCGSEPARGSFVSADSIATLAIELREAVLGKQHGSTDGRPSCVNATEACIFDPSAPEILTFDYPFELSEAITGFNLLTLSADPSVTSSLITPDGQEFQLSSTGLVTLDNGVVLDIQKLGIDDGGYLIDATSPPEGAWSGQWRVRYRTDDPAKADALNRASIYVFGGLEATMANENVPLRKGRDGTVIVKLVSAAGQPATDSSFAAGSTIDLLIDGESISSPPVNADGTFVVPVAVAEDYAGDSLTVTGTLRPVVQVSPDAPPVVLEEWTGQIGVVPVQPLPNYPLVEPPAPFLEAMDQDHRVLRSELLIDASGDEAGGCVELTSITPPTIGETVIDVDMRVFDGETEISPGETCAVTLDSGDQRVLTVELDGSSLEIADAARLAAGLNFLSSSGLDASQTEEFHVEVSASLEPILVTNVNQGFAGALMIGAVLIPILLLYGMNFLAARLEVGRHTFAEIPVRLDDGRLVRRTEEGTAGLFLLDDDLRIGALAPEGRHREVNAGGVELRGRWSWNPFADVYGEASSAGMPFLVANKGSMKKGKRGRLDASLAKAWVFRASSLPKSAAGDSRYEPVDGTLTLIVPPYPDIARADLVEQTESISDRLDHEASKYQTASQASSDAQVRVDVPDDGLDPSVSNTPPKTSAPATIRDEWDDDPAELPTPHEESHSQEKTGRRRVGRKQKNANPATPIPSPADDVSADHFDDFDF